MDTHDPSFSVDLLPGDSQPIAAVHLSTVAFVGRARRGPVNTPIVVHSFAEFSDKFGGLWLASPMSFAVYHFFENGGSAAMIVRVIKGGTRAAIDIPTPGGGCLTLQALNPGAYEFVRAAVDYDNIESPYHHLFNLTVQRVSELDGGLVLDQEIYTQVSTIRGADSFVTSVLEDSNLVNVWGTVPMQRPEVTLEGHTSGYIGVTRNGHDGDVVKGVQIVEGMSKLTGLDVPFLCLPPPSRHEDIERNTWHEALAFCRVSDTILIVDPPRSWRSVDDAKRGVERLGIADSHALLAFPGVVSKTPGGTLSNQPPCGFVAGLLTRWGAERASWEFPDGWRVRGVKRFQVSLTDDDRQELQGLGFNCFREVNAVARVLTGDKTLSPNELWSSLSASRFAYFLRISIKRGTQWAIFAPNDEALWLRLQKQVSSFLAKQFEWAVDRRDLENLFYVRCDASTNPPAEIDQGRVSIEIGFALKLPGKFHRITITHNRHEKGET